MPKPPTGLSSTGGGGASRAAFDICALVPILAFAYSAVLQPLIYFNFPPAPGLQGLLESRTENRIFWPVVAVLAVAVAARPLSRGRRLPLPPNMIGLVAYLAFAGASVLWAFKPELSFVRFTQEAMVLTALVLPALLSSANSDILRGVFLCFACGTIINVLLIPGGYATFAQYGAILVDIGYEGYFTGKNLLGEFAAIAFLFSMHEMLQSGSRRALGFIVGVAALVLLFMSNSKTALGLVIIAPILAAFTQMIARPARISPAVVVAAMLLVYIVFCQAAGFNTNRIAYLLTGDSSFTGRTTIWAFSESEIPRHPLLGWGYQSFWLVGADAPSLTDASGWVKFMPNSHNGYYDTILELGYVGLAFLLVFLTTTVHVIGHVAEHDYKRAWILLSIALFIMIYNFIETLWLRAFDVSWVVFVVVAVEAARYWRRNRLKGPAYQPQPARSIGHRSTRQAWRPRLGLRS